MAFGLIRQKIRALCTRRHAAAFKTKCIEHFVSTLACPGTKCLNLLRCNCASSLRLRAWA
ncbi:hypothetical protein HMPREF1586_01376 [Gardnerella vaginalis JCP8522]|nr:hypothetical protein HMPREF1586_01376 [Gardnerella vaginalis JCP8522]